jgi:hypothetical protein
MQITGLTNRWNIVQGVTNQMLKGKKVNLNIVERNELQVLKHWVNDVEYVGEFEPFHQETLGSVIVRCLSIGFRFSESMIIEFSILIVCIA